MGHTAPTPPCQAVDFGSCRGFHSRYATVAVYDEQEPQQVCGGWDGKYDDQFHNRKSKALVVKPRVANPAILQSAWEYVPQGFRKLQDACATPGAKRNNVVVQADGAVKIRHAIFEVGAAHTCPINITDISTGMRGRRRKFVLR